MARGYLLAFFVLIAIFWNSQNVDGCSCFPVHPQTLVCKADFVFKGKVLNENLENTDPSDPNNNFATRVYRVKLQKRIKGLIGFTPPATIRLETPGNGGLCGVRLKVSKSYIISGSIVKNKMSIFLCGGYFVRIDKLTIKERKKLYRTIRRYLKNCSCKDIKSNTKKNPVSPKKGCRLPKDFEKQRCFFKKGICVKRRNGRCKWNKKVKQCKK